jgi:hypothetical protein
VAARGSQERALLQPGEPLVAIKQRRGGASAGGFGAKGGKDVRGAKAGSEGKAGKTGAGAGAARGRPRSASTLFDEMQRNGVVRINNALSADTVSQLKEAVDSERARAEAEVGEGGDFDRVDRFADLVLLENRCDLLMPLRGAAVTALHELLGDGAVVGDLIEELVGEQGVFNELACLFSEPGARQQPLHPDTPWTSRPPLYAAFVALQASRTQRDKLGIGKEDGGKTGEGRRRKGRRGQSSSRCIQTRPGRRGRRYTLRSWHYK